jgi:hypothetical protein
MRLIRPTLLTVFSMALLLYTIGAPYEPAPARCC